MLFNNIKKLLAIQGVLVKKLNERKKQRLYIWKEKMNTQTSIERLNNRILNHYGVEHMQIRRKKRISFHTMLAGFNIHLDIQLALLIANGLFDFK